MKATKSTIKKAKPAKQETRGLDPECLYSFKKIPISEAQIERWIDKLREWPHLPENKSKRRITDFYDRECDIPKPTYYKLLDRFPDFKAIHDQTMEILATRIFDEGFEASPATMAQKYLHMYSDEFKQADQWQSSLKEKETAAGAVKFVNGSTVEETVQGDDYLLKKANAKR